MDRSPHTARRLQVRRILGADLGAAGRASTRWMIRLVLLVFGPWLELDGLERLRPLDEPVIFALNHNNSLETLVVPAALFFHRGGRTISFVVDWMFLRIPVVGWLLGHGSPVPVYTKSARWGLFERERRRRAASDGTVLDRCRRELAAGRSVGIFPEGARNRSADRLGAGRAGLGHLVLATGAPVVPVGIDFPARKRLGRVPRLGRLRVTVGEPLRFDDIRPSAPGSAIRGGAEPARTVQSMARTIVDAVLVRLGELCGKKPPERGARPLRRSRPVRQTRSIHESEVQA